LRIRGSIEPLLGVTRRSIRFDLAQFELLTNHRIRDPRIGSLFSYSFFSRLQSRGRLLLLFSSSLKCLLRLSHLFSQFGKLQLCRLDIRSDLRDPLHLFFRKSNLFGGRRTTCGLKREALEDGEIISRAIQKPPAVQRVSPSTPQMLLCALRIDNDLVEPFLFLSRLVQAFRGRFETLPFALSWLLRAQTRCHGAPEHT